MYCYMEAEIEGPALQHGNPTINSRLCESPQCERAGHVLMNTARVQRIILVDSDATEAVAQLSYDYLGLSSQRSLDDAHPDLQSALSGLR